MDEGQRRAIQAFKRGYSTAIVEVHIEGYEYRIPMNYMTPFGKQPSPVSPRYTKVSMFLPDFRGYDRDNFIDPFDKRKIVVFWGGSFGGNAPEERLANLQKFTDVAREPSGERHGLSVYRTGREFENWLFGLRPGGGMILLKCSGYAPKSGIVNPQCDVRYPNEKGGYGLAYRFHSGHLEKWREIDERINALILGWRTK